jgi:hypothetical protein
MGAKRIIFCLVYLCVSLAVCTNLLAQGSFETAEGISQTDSDNVGGYYYKDPQPDKLISVLKEMLSQDSVISNTSQFATTAHLFAAVANKDKEVLDKIVLLVDSYSGKQKDALNKIIQEAQNFYSPEPNTPKDLDYLWGEFIATGD